MCCGLGIKMGNCLVGIYTPESDLSWVARELLSISAHARSSSQSMSSSLGLRYNARSLNKAMSSL